MVAPAAGLVEMEVPICLGYVLTSLSRVSTRLPLALSKIAESADKQLGPSVVYSKSNQAAGPLCPFLDLAGNKSS